MQSLAPSMMSEPDDEGGEEENRKRRRVLLVIYIHGYNGNNQSFRSFPAHVHNYLKTSLADSHRIHSKIYPRYKTYRAMQVGVDSFSEWLRAADGEETDVVLVGHSMGGILAGEVVLMVCAVRRTGEFLSLTLASAKHGSVQSPPLQA
jgi:pimeloyl-ACP methyl ester carboxylesterase